MKKIYLSIVLIATYFLAIGQVSTSETPILNIKASNTVNQRYVAPEPAMFNKATQQANILINFIDGAGTNEQWTNEAKASFEYAVGLWENSITSDVEINIDAEFLDLGSSTLGSANATNVWANFTPTTANQNLFESDFYYVQSLANKLRGQDNSTGTVDIQARFSSTFPFYFGTDGNCPTNQYDFVTVVLHEIGHGLGFSSSARENSSNQLVYQLGSGSNQFPMIYDDFVTRPGVAASEDRLTDFTPTTSTGLTSFLTSDNLFWDSNPNDHRLYAPTTWNQGSSISHLNDGTFDNTNSALMTHALSFGEAVHNLGDAGIDIMQDIGWGEVLDLILGTGNSNWIYPHQFMFENTTTNSTSENVAFHILELDNQYDYSYDDWYTGYNYSNFRIVALHEGGMYYYTDPNHQIDYDNSTLPNSYQWKRDKDGYVQGYIEAYSINSTEGPLIIHERQMVKFEKAPNTPIFEKKQQQSGGLTSISSKFVCDKIEFTFYSEDASSYNLFYKSEDDLFETAISIPNDIYSYEITGLDENLDYEFRVEAMNSFGSTISNTITRPSCELKIIAFPNPTVDRIRVKEDDINTNITDIEIRKIDNPNIGKTATGTSTNEVEIDVQDLPNGVYDIKVTDQDGKESSKTFIKF